MEGRSGAVVVLATGIDPSPLVLPPLPSSSRPSVIAAPPSLALPPSRAHRFTPVHPAAHSLMHSETRTQTRAAGYARIRYIHANADHSSRSSTTPRLSRSFFIVSLPLPPFNSGEFSSYSWSCELEYSDSAYISGTPSIFSLHSSLFMRFYVCFCVSLVYVFFILSLDRDDLFMDEYFWLANICRDSLKIL